ncbi:MAG: hypothetical protein NTU53_11855 [Planctomycetota bacterium]|nr:hypothetical protein [Planctomycetota bacterium]
MLRSRSFLCVVVMGLVLGVAGLAQASVILAPTDPIYAVNATPGSAISGLPVTAANNHPVGEAPAKVMDNNTGTKYLNFGKTNVGFIVVPAFGPSKLTSLQMATANDSANRDPMTISIEGTAGPFSDYLGVFNTTWTPIYTGPSGIEVDPGRSTWGTELPIAPSGFFSYYRVLVTTIRDAGTANSTQFSEFKLNGVPEPAALSLLAFAGLLIRRRH